MNPKYAFFGLTFDGQYIPGDAKLHRVFQRIQREQPSAELRVVYSIKGLKEFAPDKLFLQPAPEGESYPPVIEYYPCEKDYLENWAND